MVIQDRTPGNARKHSSRRIFAGDLWPPLDIATAERRRAQLQSAQDAISNLIHYLLLYDQIIIPTQDFMILVVLVNILGEKNLISLLEEGTVRFVRVRGSLAYAGSGGKVHGLCAFHITQTASGGSAHPYSRSLEDVLEWSLAFLPSATNQQRLAALTLGASEELPIETIQGAIKAETESDILLSERLGRYLSPEEIRGGKLPSLRGKEIRLFSTAKRYDEVDFVLAVAHRNTGLYLAKQLQCEDSGSAVPMQELLAAKLDRAVSDRPVEDWTSFRKLADIPDLGAGVVAGSLPVHRLLELRNSRGAQEFRVWFHEHCRVDIETTAKSYVRLVTSLPRVGTLPLKVLRFVLASAIGFWNPPLGVAASAADSFGLERLFSRGANQPKIFVDRVRRFGERLRAKNPSDQGSS